MNGFTAIAPALLLSLTLCACTGNAPQAAAPATQSQPETAVVTISPEEAKSIMDTESSYILLDVRTQDEYKEGHIPGAMVIPVEVIAQEAEKALPDKDALILLYCRSGRRSLNAAKTLVDMGYTNVRDFGGILSWPYEVVTD